jgi:hypothetical protein
MSEKAIPANRPESEGQALEAENVEDDERDGISIDLNADDDDLSISKNTVNHPFNEAGEIEGNVDSNQTEDIPTTPAPKDAEVTAEKTKAEQLDVVDQIGYLRGEFACTNRNVGGVLYAGSEGFAFKGNIFFYVHQYFVSWSSVSRVRHSDQGQILIQCIDGREYIFAAVAQADRVWAILVALQSEFFAESPHRTPSVSSLRASLRRRNSEPLPSSSSKEEGPTSGGQEEAYVAAATAATMNDLRVSLSSTRRSFMLESPFASLQMSSARLLSSDLEEAWSQLHESGSEIYAETAIELEEIHCSLEKFYELFFSNEAPHSIAKFMSDSGDENVVASRWKKGEEDIWTRTIEYSHPVNAPLAPPMARARKEQRLRRFGNHGISVETDTYVDDVPMTDCFYVTDRLLISSTEENGTVRLTAHFDIRFVKSTMFRAIIANTTKSEFLKSFQTLLAMMRRQAGTVTQQLGVEEDKVVVSTQPTPMKTDTPPANATTTTTQILIALISLVLLLQFYIILDLRAMRIQMDTMIAQSNQCTVDSGQ